LKDEWIEYKLLHKEIEMKLKRIAAMVAVLILCLSSLTFTADKEEKEPIKHLETDAEKMSYTLGLDTGKRLKSLPIEVDLTIFLKGVEDTIKENKLLLTPEEAEEMMAKIRQKVMAKEIEQMMKQAEKNLKEGEAFLAENGKKDGVVTTKSGLQYIILREGDGPKPTVTDKVEVDYEGRLIDGTVFDSSYQRGESITFGVNRVIAGWTEALQLMNVGSKYRLFIPSNLAYRERGAGGDIGPNAVLIFEVELLSIVEEEEEERR
jgi:FKBP-type peptidyl-prolyl cis-trans isomerase